MLEQRNLSLWRFNISTAFLHADLKEDVYIEPPPGTGTNPNELWKLKKAVYALWIKTSIKGMEQTSRLVFTVNEL
jgi:hypothetical protein